MKIFYADQFVLPLPPGHRFPMAKYAMLRELLAKSGPFQPEDFRVPDPALDEQLLLVHSPAYVERVKNGTLSTAQIRRLGFPWSEELVQRSRRSCGGTIGAARIALREGLAANLAGGTHHAFPEECNGFCVFNDAAVAARTLQAEGLVRRVLIIDLDVHQGDGTAFIFRDDPSVFTFSMHGARNYPLRKVPGNLDVGLPDGTGDAAYLDSLRQHLNQAIWKADAQLAIYLAGADPFVGDRLGRLSLTMEGLAARDEIVLNACRAAGLPIAIVMAGGYAHNIADTVAIHARTVLLAGAGWTRQGTRESPPRPAVR